MCHPGSRRGDCERADRLPERSVSCGGWGPWLSIPVVLHQWRHGPQRICGHDWKPFLRVTTGVEVLLAFSVVGCQGCWLNILPHVGKPGHTHTTTDTYLAQNFTSAAVEKLWTGLRRWAVKLPWKLQRKVNVKVAKDSKSWFIPSLFTRFWLPFSGSGGLVSKRIMCATFCHCVSGRSGGWSAASTAWPRDTADAGLPKKHPLPWKVGT